MYASAAVYCNSFDYEDATELLLDVDRVLTVELLRAAVEGVAYPVGATAGQQAVAVAARARLERKLSIISNFMDGYLRAAVTLPLPAGSADEASLEECCNALTREALSNETDKINDLVTTTADRWRAWLKDIASKKVQLVTPEGAPVTSSAGKARTGQTVSRYDWGAFDGGGGL